MWGRGEREGREKEREENVGWLNTWKTGCYPYSERCLEVVSTHHIQLSHLLQTSLKLAEIPVGHLTQLCIVHAYIHLRLQRETHTVLILCIYMYTCIVHIQCTMYMYVYVHLHTLQCSTHTMYNVYETHTVQLGTPLCFRN